MKDHFHILYSLSRMRSTFLNTLKKQKCQLWFTKCKLFFLFTSYRVFLKKCFTSWVTCSPRSSGSPQHSLWRPSTKPYYSDTQLFRSKDYAGILSGKRCPVEPATQSPVKLWWILSNIPKMYVLCRIEISSQMEHLLRNPFNEIRPQFFLLLCPIHEW